MSRVEPPELPGLHAWKVQRRNRRRRLIMRAAILFLAAAGGVLALPQSINPLVYAGLLGTDDTEAARQARADDLAARLASRQSPHRPLPALSDRQPAPLPPPTLPAADIQCLAKTILAEAPGDNLEAQFAVGQIVMNFARKVGVGPCQALAKAPRCYFPQACLAIARPNAAQMRNQWQQVQWVAEEIAAGRGTLRELAHAERYHSYLYAVDWSSSMRRIRRIGGLVFYAPFSAPDPDLTMALAKPKQPWDEPASMQWVDHEVTERQVEVLSHAQMLPQPRPAVVRKAVPTQGASSAREAFNPFSSTGSH